MSNRMKDERFAELDGIMFPRGTGSPYDLASEIFLALKADRQRISDLEYDNKRLKGERLAFATEAEELRAKIDKAIRHLPDNPGMALGFLQEPEDE